ncbi:polyprenyl synthetase family protein [Pseudomonas putida]|uniref:polyprenyl synthetase family protein n=1 Tax=Pseudomonas TaxID=286 RepID=UPI00105A6C18|nr:MULTISPECIES: polyprenyl synthetase family protein [Pseudomonas]MBF8748274.1 polyprenyl synthetase family protein [Pseudomonas monteilii]MCT8165237.1 polyprenyl synthetase family protein [Pseudomonas sp. HD6422]MCT8184096.1 polyprenyl synthetase family protein [Pseudomonas sp. HD6421]TDJ79064.1 polyprenyl synthetase family protein [Pseudomonas putida]
MTTIAHSPQAAETGSLDSLIHLQGAIEARLEALLPAAGSERDLVAAAMRDCTLAPGKRLRPLLLVLAAEGLGACPKAALDVGCAIEMVHAASLVLDDLPCMDDATLRRGRATLHLAFGEDVALLAAIALLSRAFALVARLEGVSPQVRADLVATLADAIGSQGLVKGQLQDLRDGILPRSAEQIVETNQLKTGALFGAILAMAGHLADATAALQASLQRFAGELGQAFQLYDDLRDRDAGTGKDPDKDHGKSTLLALCGEEAVRDRLAVHLANAEHYLAEASLGERKIVLMLRSVFTCTGSSQSNFHGPLGSSEQQPSHEGAEHGTRRP